MLSPVHKLITLLAGAIIGIEWFFLPTDKTPPAVVASSRTSPPSVTEAQFIADERPVASEPRAYPRVAAKFAEVVASPWEEEKRALCELARQSPEAALARVGALPLAEDREAALQEVCQEIARRDPGQALDAAWRWGLGRTDGPADGSVLEKLATQCATIDLSATLAWLSSSSVDAHDERREFVIAGVATSLVKTEPAAAAALVAEQIPEGSTQWRAALTVIDVWAHRDLAGATAWVQSFPEGNLRNRALEALASRSNATSPNLTTP